MRNRVLNSVWLLAVCLPALATAQEGRAFRGADTWEFGLAGGISILDADLRNFLASGAPESRFAESLPSSIAPSVAVRLGYNFGANFGFSLGGTATMGSGVRYLSPDASVTWTWNLNARTSPFMLAGMHLTRIDGINSRTTHSTWGAQGGVGIRQMIGDRTALRLQGRLLYDRYREFSKSYALTPVITLGFSYFGRGRPATMPAATVFLRGRVDTLVRARLDTAWVSRVDTVHGIVYVMEPAADQLLLRVQFETDSAVILPLSRPVLDTIAMALVADRAFRELRAPVKRVSPPHVPVPFSLPLEDAIGPSEEKITAAIRAAMA